MRKMIFYSLLLTMCFAAGCKKDYQNSKVYFLSQEIIDDRAEGHPLDTISYTYDGHGHITNITDGTSPNKISFGIDYDAAGRVATAKKYDNSGALIIEFDFYYTAAATGYYFYGLNHTLSDTAVFEYNDKKQIVKIQTGHSGSQLFTYDSKGNITTSDGFGADGANNLYDNISYAYDNGRNPFSETAPGNLFFMYVAYTDPSTLINNIQVRDGDTYNYTYNADKFPIKATVNTGTAIITIYYNYQIL